MSKIGIITSRTLAIDEIFSETDKIKMATPYGQTDGKVRHGFIQGREVVLLVRNGDNGKVPPHKINYRANVYAFKELGVKRCFALSPATGIRADLQPGVLVLPSQLIDYTHSRPHTFFDDEFSSRCHVDFQAPYSEVLRQHLVEAADSIGLEVYDEAVYGISQGPRLETLAEINRLERDGCDLVGMSGMPEAILARECEIEYTALALITDKAAGRAACCPRDAESMSALLKSGLARLQELLTAAIPQLR